MVRNQLGSEHHTNTATEYTYFRESRWKHHRSHPIPNQADRLRNQKYHVLFSTWIQRLWLKIAQNYTKIDAQFLENIEHKWLGYIILKSTNEHNIN